ncbi:mannose-6-phosphate isomerase ManA [Clostridium homopropionicum DSM 5847]|uniref:mannose-6-phosphate isomerase n=1 Tax=Clostridium homopropionicum DSM 5847 TaxID=1121318 RepID=A0A0L6ZC73_9CLOT|nr:mannose-6-phosphate isomerase, class I [Clostridium homopropionicum]KOA20584.1 mannose-6-phosphate isomerase ManA [Clostridium homopropionicum DSM 5847]SFF93830.1 mannose-6-phosphate isomerase, type 1 [Clostridium homopropionicum]
MLYPLKFKPIFKDYIWGGRNLEKLNKELPQGNVAESWEISCHKDGMSIVQNGHLAGKSLEEIISIYAEKLLGTSIVEKFKDKFPLIIKFIDANKDLSVQVHPNDEYARIYENGQNGKNEMWYTIDCKPGARIVYGLKEDVTKERFLSSINENKIKDCLNYIEVLPGDFVYIPSGTIHAIGEGIVIAEIQQSSNLTYRVYDYDRVDKNGNKRELHVDKALEVIDFNTIKTDKQKDNKINIGGNSTMQCKIKSHCFNVDLYDIKEEIDEVSDKNRFFTYLVVEGKGKIKYGDETMDIDVGDSILIPAELGKYTIEGQGKMLKTYIL